MTVELPDIRRCIRYITSHAKALREQGDSWGMGRFAGDGLVNDVVADVVAPGEATKVTRRR